MTTRSTRRTLALAALGALMAACAGPPPPTVAARPGTAPVTGASLSQPTPPRSAPPQSTPDAAPSLAALPVPAPARRAPQPEEIVDHPERTVRAVLGAPDLQRREPPAEVWQYGAEGCVLDITFYPATDGGPARAAYLESRTLAGIRLEPAACLASLGRAADRD